MDLSLHVMPVSPINISALSLSLTHAPTVQDEFSVRSLSASWQPFISSLSLSGISFVRFPIHNCMGGGEDGKKRCKKAGSDERKERTTHHTHLFSGKKVIFGGPKGELTSGTDQAIFFMTLAIQEHQEMRARILDRSTPERRQPTPTTFSASGLTRGFRQMTLPASVISCQ